IPSPAQASRQLWLYPEDPLRFGELLRKLPQELFKPIFCFLSCQLPEERLTLFLVQIPPGELAYPRGIERRDVDQVEAEIDRATQLAARPDGQQSRILLDQALPLRVLGAALTGGQLIQAVEQQRRAFFFQQQIEMFPKVSQLRSDESLERLAGVSPSPQPDEQ